MGWLPPQVSEQTNRRLGWFDDPFSGEACPDTDRRDPYAPSINSILPSRVRCSTITFPFGSRKTKTSRSPEVGFLDWLLRESWGDLRLSLGTRQVDFVDSRRGKKKFVHNDGNGAQFREADCHLVSPEWPCRPTFCVRAFLADARFCILRPAFQ